VTNRDQLPLTPGVHSVATTDADGQQREFLVCVPTGPVKLIGVIFHPFDASPELVVYGEEPGDYLITHLDGMLRPAEAVGMLVIAPRARGRVLDRVSLAWKPHLDAAWDLAVRARDETGASAIITGGLSMGGLEALVFAGQHADEISAVWAVNPVVDIAAWYRDLVDRHPDGAPDEPTTRFEIAEELGGTPEDAAASYRVRSANSYASELSRTKVRITWSPHDTVIPNAATAHAHPLAMDVRAHGGDVTEVILTREPSDSSLDAGRVAHESCDVWENTGWAFAIAIALA
jgi:pimeloyl-ACP methyl ester carboxylesterase